MSNTLFKLIVIAIVLTALMQSCAVKEPVSNERIVNLDTLVVKPDLERKNYRASNTRLNDLLHTKLEVSFDWDSTYLYGKAHLQFRPYFYPTDSLILDAKGFQIKEVSLLDSLNRKKSIVYSYDSLQLIIKLDKIYNRTDTYSIFIDYIAMPNKLDKGGSSAISSDIGLYFINPDGSDPTKPRQIWTQGETEASSCWFPTIDSPNERMTQEIFITVDTSFITLSNGSLMFQTENGDGSRTDYWKQKLPDAPYLTMMAIGEFAKVEDQWKNIPVNYFVEWEYKDIAKKIYPNTVEMIEFFSNQLGVDYPWEKYDQIVVRDYVSGAMENTSAVIYGDFIQGDERYLIENSGEDIVAHELYHHWFGNLVTTESWSNLPLNESFATYGEYLWNEHKYGKDQADYGLQNDLDAYLQEAEIEEKRLIRYYYDHRMEMFDRHSYQKGGRVLHMLRNYVGDEAFFLSLNKYLKDNAYTSVEIHNLRLAFEEVVGEDLNWFFNQWFLEKGHPVLKTSWEYNASAGKVVLNLKQVQKGEGIVQIFKLPMYIDMYYGNTRIREEITMDQREQEFEFKVHQKPDLVNVDGEKMLLAEFIEEKSVKEWQALYECGGNYISRRQAVNKLNAESDSISLDIMQKALNDTFWNIRVLAISNMEELQSKRADKSFQILQKLAAKDPKSDVRATAIFALGDYFPDKVPTALLQEKLQDPSYIVVASALSILYEKDEDVGLLAAEVLEDTDNDEVILSVANVYSNSSKSEQHEFFIEAFDRVDTYSKYALSSFYGEYLEGQDVDVMTQAASILEKETSNEEIWWIRMININNLKSLKEWNAENLKAQKKELNKESNPEAIADINKKILQMQNLDQQIEQSMKRLSETEENENLKRMLEN